MKELYLVTYLDIWLEGQRVTGRARENQNEMEREGEREQEEEREREKEREGGLERCDMT